MEENSQKLWLENDMHIKITLAHWKKIKWELIMEYSTNDDLQGLTNIIITHKETNVILIASAKINIEELI